MPEIAINDETGERMMWDGAAWKPLPSRSAPGAQYLLEDFSQDRKDKSEDAYYRTWRDKDNTAVSGARTGIRNARRLEGILKKQAAQGQGTGGIYGVPVVGAVAGWMDPEIRELDAIQSETARSKRQPGEGAISDFDAQQFMAMTYGKDKPLKTNESLIRASRVAEDAVLQRRAFAEWHRSTYGNLTGIEEAWDRYAQDNPIFDPVSETSGEPALNAKRSNWREYFGVVRGAGDTRKSQAQEDVERAAGVKKPALPPAARAAYAIQQAKAKGAAKPLGTEANPFLARDQTTFDKLISNPAYKGRYVVAPNGDFGMIE